MAEEPRTATADNPIDRIISRRKRAKEVKDQWRDLMSDAYEFALPQRNLFYNAPAAGSTQGQKKVDRVFDSTAQTGAINFANRIQSDMMPPFHKWAILKAGPMVPENLRDQVNQQLEFINDQLFAVLQASNFDTANNETLLDLAIGTGVLFIFENNDDVGIPVMYVPAPIGIVALEEGPWGDIVGIYMEHHQITIRDIEYTWPDATIPQSITDKTTQDPDAKIDLFAACLKDMKSGHWKYHVIYESEKLELVERTYTRQPAATPRWIKVAGETYGRGPVIQALPDIKTLNKMVEYMLKNNALNIAGVYTGVADNVLNPNKVVIRPGAIIPVGSNGGTKGPSLKALERSGTFDLALIQWEKLTANIKRFLLDKSLPDDIVTAQPRTATEIIARMRQLAAEIGAPFGRLVREHIVPVIQSTLAIMEKRGLVPKVKIDGLAVQVQVTSPLAQEQNLSEVEVIVQWLEILATFGEEIMLLTAKVEEAGTVIGQKLGVPSKLIRTDDEKKQIESIAGQLAEMKIKQMKAATPDSNTTPIAADGTFAKAA